MAFQFVVFHQLHGRVAFLPFTAVTFKALKPNNVPSCPRTIGEHVKKRRCELGLTQQQVADMLGVSEWTVLNWENDKTEPPIRTIPAVIRFLGYDPYPLPATLGDRLYAKRRLLGWSKKRAARELGVDEETWAKWEEGTRQPTAAMRRSSKSSSEEGTNLVKSPPTTPRSCGTGLTR